MSDGPANNVQLGVRRFLRNLGMSEEFFEIRGFIRERFKQAASLPAEEQAEAIAAFADDFVRESGDPQTPDQEKIAIFDMFVAAFIMWRATGKNKIKMKKLGKAAGALSRLVEWRRANET